MRGHTGAGGWEMQLSICITHYEAERHLDQCLTSIERNAPQCEYEIVVVDDASPRPCNYKLKPRHPHVRFMINATNLGFAGANNRAVRESKGRYVLLLNNDTEVLPGALDALVRFLDSHEDVGAVGPKLLNTDGSFQPQCKRGMLSPLSGIAYSFGLDRRFPMSRLLAEYLMTYAEPHQIHDVKGLSGACILARRNVLEQVGLLDESFGMYGEDLDLCYRIGAAGWRISYLPSARVIHHGGKGGSASMSYRNLYLYHRALWILFRRYPQTRLFPIYAWLAWLAIAARFLGCVGMNSLRHEKRVGTVKGRRLTGALCNKVLIRNSRVGRITKGGEE